MVADAPRQFERGIGGERTERDPNDGVLDVVVGAVAGDPGLGIEHQLEGTLLHGRRAERRPKSPEAFVDTPLGIVVRRMTLWPHVTTPVGQFSLDLCRCARPLAEQASQAHGLNLP